MAKPLARSWSWCSETEQFDRFEVMTVSPVAELRVSDQSSS